MKHYKIINTRTNGRPQVITEKGLKIMQDMQELRTSIKVLGECDANGNVLHEMAEANFTPPAASIPPVFKDVQKPSPVTSRQVVRAIGDNTGNVDIDSDDNFQNFDDNGGNKPESGAQQAQAKKAGRTAGGKSGAKKD